MSQSDRSALAPVPSRAATPAPVAAGSTPRATPGDRSPAAIERDIEAIRQRLAASIDELAERVHPKAVANRAVDRAKLTVVDESGAPRTGRLAAVGGALATLTAFVIWRRRR